MWLLQQFICFYYIFTVLIRSQWSAAAVDGGHEHLPLVGQLPNQQHSTTVDRAVWLTFDSPVFLHEDLELECNYQLNNKQLYSIKWYKDEQEFFQYVPHERPPVRSFASKGVRFKAPIYSVANETFRLWLHNVNLDTQGDYRCEISTDAPDFTTLKDHKTLEVYVLPSKSPRITGSRANFHPKGRVDLNCTSPKSKPVSTLQWFIGNTLAPSEYLIAYKKINHADGLQSRTLGIKFLVNEEHFKNGQILKCVATYQKIANQTWIRRYYNATSIRSSEKHQPEIEPIAENNNSSQRHVSMSLFTAVILMLLLYLASFSTVAGVV